ncbi:MAG: GIY-YIG nuclease family protein [Nitrospira sp.]|nr:GIY-YIG nuclease family protein [Nitrospira sp.]
MKDEEWAQVVAERAAKQESEARQKGRPGYLYLLVHPDLPGYFKLGHTTKQPQTRLKEHNSYGNKFLGQIVQRTGKLWQLIYFVPVTDARRAESYFYDVLPRFGNLELMRGSIESVIEQELKRSPYLDEARFAELQEEELRDCDVEALLESMRAEWAQDGVTDACEKMVRELTEERRRKDGRYC